MLWLSTQRNSTTFLFASLATHIVALAYLLSSIALIITAVPMLLYSLPTLLRFQRSTKPNLFQTLLTIGSHRIDVIGFVYHPLSTLVEFCGISLP